MPIQMKKSGDITFEITIESAFDPQEDHVVEVVDMDTRDDVSSIDGKPYTSLVWKYKVYDGEGIAYSDDRDGSVFEGWEFSSMALTPKAKARQWASAFLGHELSDAEADAIADDFDGAIVGKRARVSWKVEEKGGGKRLRWALVRPLLVKRSAPAPATTAGTARNVEPTVTSNGPALQQSTPNSAYAPGRETPAQKRARLEAELASMDNGDQGGDDDLPF